MLSLWLLLSIWRESTIKLSNGKRLIEFFRLIFLSLEDEKWILKTLKSKNIKKVKDVLIFMIDENDDIFIQRKKE